MLIISVFSNSFICAETIGLQSRALAFTMACFWAQPMGLKTWRSLTQNAAVLKGRRASLTHTQPNLQISTMEHLKI